MYVFICEKKMQPYAKTIQDLTCVQVTEVLTKHDHPRGIKVRGIVMQPSGNGFKPAEKMAVGRVVYIGRMEES